MKKYCERFAIITVAVAVVAMTTTASQAQLYVYEPFDYTDGADLNGQGGTGLETGFAAGSTWSTFVTNTGSGQKFEIHQQGATTGIYFNNSPNEVPNPYTNTLTSLPTAGNFAGRNAGPNSTTSAFPNPPLGADHMQANRALDPSVTATFQDGTSTWFSFVSARGFDLNARAPTFAIGEGILIEDRGKSATGPVIAVGGFSGNDATGANRNVGNEFLAQFKDTGGNGTLTASDQALSNETWVGGTTSTSAEMVNILVARIDWGATAADPDLISYHRFLDGDILDEVTFDANATTPFGAALDQSTFTNLSIGGGRYLIDELRIGGTFNDVIGQSVAVAVPEPASVAIWTLLGLALCGWGVYRRRQA